MRKMYSRCAVGAYSISCRSCTILLTICNPKGFRLGRPIQWTQGGLMVQCPLAAPAATSVLEGVGDWNAGVLRGRPLRAAEGWVGIWRSDGSLVDHAQPHDARARCSRGQA